MGISIEDVYNAGTFFRIKTCPCCGEGAVMTFGYTPHKDNELVFIKCQNVACGLQTETAYIEIESSENVKNALIREQIERWNRRESYMEGYKNGRADEAGLRDGTIMQTFSPD